MHLGPYAECNEAGHIHVGGHGGHHTNTVAFGSGELVFCMGYLVFCMGAKSGFCGPVFGGPAKMRKRLGFFERPTPPLDPLRVHTKDERVHTKD